MQHRPLLKSHGKLINTRMLTDPQASLSVVDFTPKSKIICITCRGAKCKHEDWTLCENPAVRGLHSNFITDQIIASQ